ncbi:MAG: phosphate ABC transporter substrate-binding protein [Pseudomonadota bacterium]
MRALLIPLVCALVLCLATTAADADVVAVVSAKSSVIALSKYQVADIFLGKAVRFPNGEQAVPIDQKEGTAARTEFYTIYANKSPAQLKAHWSKIVFTGRGRPPTAVANSAEAKKLVAADSRAITYIDRGAVDGSVRVLTEP